MDSQALGRYLRENRELKELSLDDAVNALKIRRNILESFEMGNFNVSESAVQIRGMIRNYARFLSLDEDRVLDLYETSLRDTHRKRGTSKRASQELPIAPRKITDTPPALPAVKLKEPRGTNRNNLQGVLLALVMLALTCGAVGVIIYVVFEFIRTPDDSQFVADQATQDPLMGTLLPTLTYTASWTPRPTQPTATMPFTGPLVGEMLTIDLNPTQRVWLRVISDGDTIFTGIMRPNEATTFTAVSRLDMIASNAAALDIVFNNQPQPRFGLHAQQVALVFTSQGVEIQKDDSLFQPTPETSPTPLPTPTDIAGTAIARLTPTVTEGPSLTPSETLIPTQTSVPSATPSVTLTPSETATPTLTPTTTLTPTQTLPPSATPLPTNTPTLTPIPTQTNTPQPTAILPPRVTATGLAPTKAP
jgi:hypothetical protein